MTAIEYLKKADWDKFDLTRAESLNSNPNCISFWEISSWDKTEPSKVNYAKYGFIFRYGPEKNNSYRESSLNIHFNSEFNYCIVQICGITYVSKDLSRIDREWLEDWSRIMSEKIYAAKEAVALSFLIEK